MCTLVVAIRPWEGIPLVIAANRDEVLARPSSRPFLWSGSVRMLAPRDDLAGGSWLGLNEHALFVAITNRSGTRPDPSRRSRGSLVIEALQASSATSLHARLASLDPTEFNPFHLFYADRTTAYLTWADGSMLHQTTLPQGLHIITEQNQEDIDSPRASSIRARWADIAQISPFSLLNLRSVVTEHAIPARHGTCVHDEQNGYGTRSSLLFVLGDDWSTTSMLWAEGHPCEALFVDQRSLLAVLK